ncbi:retrovirus-related pol polyprotein from transposon TNT 1-94 [Tanacetum coccineum]
MLVSFLGLYILNGEQRLRNSTKLREKNSLDFKAKKVSRDETCSTSRCRSEDYAWRLETSSSSFKSRGGSWSDNGEEDDEKVKDKTCLIAQASSEICLGVDLEPDEWIKDSGCSKHMTGRKPTLDYFRVFGSKCFILNTKDHLTKFDPKSYEGVFLGYSQNSKAYIIINKHTRKVEESLNVTFDETPPPSKTSPLVDDDLDEEEAIKVTEKKNLENDIEDETLEIDEIVNIKESRNHPLENVIGNLNQRTLRSQAHN